MTETKVDSLDFSPRGITLFSAHRKRKEKKGGGLTIGYANKADITLKEIKTKSNDILEVEGTVLKKKFRMILCVILIAKSTTDVFYRKNRKIQEEVEKLMEVEDDTELVCLGDMNGRLRRLEPNIKNDENGKMIESWMTNKDMHLLNDTEECTGVYTFESLNGHSAIDHILTNDTMAEKYLGMFIDEQKSLLNISDHNLVRAWFKLNPGHKKPKWNKTTTKTITWISRDQDRLVKCTESFKKKIGKKISFGKCMRKLKSSIDETLRRRKRIKLAGKDQVRMISAP